MAEWRLGTMDESAKKFHVFLLLGKGGKKNKERLQEQALTEKKHNILAQATRIQLFMF
jgi:hypothetical protein